MEHDPGGYHCVEAIASGRVPGRLVSGSALVRVKAGDETRVLAIRRTDCAVEEPGKWQAPGGRLSPEELPTHGALRELTEEVKVSGSVSDWKDALVNIGGPSFHYLTQDGIHHLRNRFVYMPESRTVEFYVLVTLEVPSFESVSFEDNEGMGRELSLLTPEELKAMAASQQLTRPFEGMLRDARII